MNILLVNTNQISIRSVEELLAKNNIHGEIAMVRAGKFALDLVQGMNVDLLVCEIESETKEKTKHFISESRKLTPDAYYFVLMDGESLEYMEEDFLNSLDDFITIPFEDRALKLRLNKGILSCIGKKKKADVAFGRSPVKAPETASVKPAPQETLHDNNVWTENPVEFQDNTGLPDQAAGPEKKEEAVPGSMTPSKRKIPREEFQYEPSYEELLQQRNKNLRKEKEAAWLQAMSSQISSYASEEEPERPLRIREERKSESLIPSNAESQMAMQPEPEILVVPIQDSPQDPEPAASQASETLPQEMPPEKFMEPSAALQKSKSKVKSLFESFSKLKMKSIPQTLQPLLASSGAGRADAVPGMPAYPTPEPREAPEREPDAVQQSTSAPEIQEEGKRPSYAAEVPESSHFGSPDAPFAEPSFELSSEPALEPFPGPSAGSPTAQSEEPSIEPSSEQPEDTPEDTPIEPVAQETVSLQDPEDPIPTDDVIPEESFLEMPVTDEEFIQEVPPSVPEASMDDQQEEEAAESVPTAEQVPLAESPEEAAPSESPVEQALPMEERIVETWSRQEEDEENLSFEDAAVETSPTVEVPEGELPENGLSQEIPDPPDNSAEGEPIGPSPMKDNPTPTDLGMDADDREEVLAAESDPQPSQVPHLQDEVWMDPTDILFLEADESLDETDESTEDLVEEDEIFGREENAEISLGIVENPILEEVLVMPFEEDGLPESLGNLPETPSSPTVEDWSLEEEKVMLADAEGLSSAPEAEDTASSHSAITVEKEPEPGSAAPNPEETPDPPKKESLDLRQYLKDSEENEEKDLKSRLRKVFGKRFPS